MRRLTGRLFYTPALNQVSQLRSPGFYLARFGQLCGRMNPLFFMRCLVNKNLPRIVPLCVPDKETLPHSRPSFAAING